ncbi:MAG: TraB/GumN family protein [Candidatus Berkiellales bacterium]
MQGSSIKDKVKNAQDKLPLRKTPLLYRISRKDIPFTSLLFGTAHKASAKHTPFRPEKSKDFDTITHFVSENGEENFEVFDSMLALRASKKLTLGTLCFGSENNLDGRTATVMGNVFDAISRFMQEYSDWHLIPDAEQLKPILTSPEALKELTFVEMLEHLGTLLEKNFPATARPKFSKYSNRLNTLKKDLPLAKEKLKKVKKYYDVSDLPEDVRHIGMEPWLTLNAKKRNKTIVKLETGEEGAQWLTEIGEENQIFQNISLARLETNSRIRLAELMALLLADPMSCLIEVKKHLIGFYQYKLQKYSTKHHVFDEFLNVYNQAVTPMTDEEVADLNPGPRNRKWMERLCEVLESNPSFVYVGQGHIQEFAQGEKDSLITLLRDRGFTLTPEECPQAPEVKAPLQPQVSKKKLRI